MMLPQSSIEHVTGLSEMLTVKPAYEDCAQVKDDCLAAGCCAPSGSRMLEGRASACG